MIEKNELKLIFIFLIFLTFSSFFFSQTFIAPNGALVKKENTPMLFTNKSLFKLQCFTIRW